MLKDSISSSPRETCEKYGLDLDSVYDIFNSIMNSLNGLPSDVALMIIVKIIGSIRYCISPDDYKEFLKSLTLNLMDIAQRFEKEGETNEKERH